jgi:hypothetical protein
MSEPLSGGTESSTVAVCCQEENPCIFVSYFLHLIPLARTARVVRRSFKGDTANV